jgi:hypothetical protein
MLGLTDASHYYFGLSGLNVWGMRRRIVDSIAGFHFSAILCQAFATARIVLQTILGCSYFEQG